MKVSLNWLKDYISVDLDPSVISEKLTMAGLEVDGVEQKYQYLDDIVVAKVCEVKKHPNADKLSICMVDTGQDELIQIVCGAPNVKEGMTAPCALPGTIMPSGMKIKKGKLRGEISAGMLCSASELKLSEDSSGLMELDNELVPGTALSCALDMSDVVFEIDLTPNRPDCLSMIGTAREIGAFTEPKQKVRLPDFSLPEKRIINESIHDHAQVEILDPDLCPRYSAGLVFDVKIGPSPFWLQQKLEAIGLTPINNVVDITNFVMMETGQPLHAFDFDMLAQGRIIVRRAGNDEEFTTLDAKTHKLAPDMLMICDGEKPVAIAGVMGGENSEISDATTRVLVESAYFNPVSIRKTAKKTGMATDASHRFERGIDPDGSVRALNRAVALIAELCDASILNGIIDEHPQKPVRREIIVNPDALNTRLGTEFDTDTIKDILNSVEFEVKILHNNLLKVTVPFFRVDIERPEDLSEEVARLWGYNNIKTSYPMTPAKGRPVAPEIKLREKTKQIMCGFSFHEAINYNFIHENSCDRLCLPENDRLRRVESILNPISDQMSVLRTSMIPGLLETMKKNIAKQSDTLKLFEIGKVFFATDKGKQPEELEMIAGLVTGKRTSRTWHSKKTDIDFFDLKGVIEGLLNALMIKDAKFEKIQDIPYYKKGYAAQVTAKGVTLGTLGRVSEKVLKNFGLKQDAFVFDFSMKAMLEVLPKSVTAQALPRFPSVSRDITIIVNKSVAVGDILDYMTMVSKKQPLIETIFLFDAFEGSPLDEEKKSLSFRVVYRSASKTLKEKNITKVHAGISKMVIEAFDAGLPE